MKIIKPLVGTLLIVVIWMMLTGGAMWKGGFNEATLMGTVIFKVHQWLDLTVIRNSEPWILNIYDYDIDYSGTFMTLYVKSNADVDMKTEVIGSLPSEISIVQLWTNGRISGWFGAYNIGVGVGFTVKASWNAPPGVYPVTLKVTLRPTVVLN